MTSVLDGARLTAVAMSQGAVLVQPCRSLSVDA